jgi:riboflavin synthase
VFSGIVIATGTVRVIRRVGEGARAEIACTLPGEALAPGESIAVQGVCLTVAAPSAVGFAADLSAETLARTTLGRARAGRAVNLERAMRLGDRLGGHLVLGHVDGTVPVAAVRSEHGSRTVRFALPMALRAEVAEKGSVAVDGVSLTVSALGVDYFEVALIPTTLAQTTLAELRPGALANLETDVLAKYVRRALGGSRPDLAMLLGDCPDAAD